MQTKKENATSPVDCLFDNAKVVHRYGHAHRPRLTVFSPKSLCTPFRFSSKRGFCFFLANFCPGGRDHRVLGRRQKKRGLVLAVCDALAARLGKDSQRQKVATRGLSGRRQEIGNGSTDSE